MGVEGGHETGDLGVAIAPGHQEASWHPLQSNILRDRKHQGHGRFIQPLHSPLNLRVWVAWTPPQAPRSTAAHPRTADSRRHPARQTHPSGPVAGDENRLLPDWLPLAGLDHLTYNFWAGDKHLVEMFLNKDFEGILGSPEVQENLQKLGAYGTESGQPRLKGSSLADLELSYLGWELGQLVSSGDISTREDLVGYINEKVLEQSR